MSIEKLRPSFTFTEDRLKELQSVVPEAFVDGKINWDVLREAMGEYLEEENQEHFGLFWPGKREARRLAAMPSKGTLVPQPGQGINEDTTHNIFIEGENLEVLKLLQKSYAGRIKMIYIDPPYNTGNDFIYPDDYSEPLEAYLKRTSQMDEAGQLLTTNTRASGRFHSNWLNMIYPRLLLAHQLLREDGVIFVSIDDNEVYNLRQVMNEIFGDENFVGCLPTIMNLKGNNDQYGFAGTHEYTLVFVKNKDITYLNEFILDDEDADEWEEDDLGYYKKGANLKSTGQNAPRERRPNLFFPIYISEDSTLSLSRKQDTDIELLPITDDKEMSWRWSKVKFLGNLDNIIVVRSKSSIGIYKKQRPSLGDLPSKKPKSVFYKPEYSSGNGTAELKSLFHSKLFDAPPKPIGLIKDFITIGTSQFDIILDLFAGSCTSAHAVLHQNRENSSKRQFIMIQLPELTKQDSPAFQAGYYNISEIGKERIRRAIRRMEEERVGQMNLNPEEDLGFKVLSLEHSQFKDWQPYTENELTQLESLFDQFETPLVQDWKPQVLLIEILLVQGFPLDSQVIPLDSFQHNIIKRVASEACAYDLFVCLDPAIHPDTIQRLSLRPEDIFVCLDSALIDEAKIQLADRCNLKVI